MTADPECGGGDMPCIRNSGGPPYCAPFPGTPATTYATYATHTPNTTKHCCPAVQQSFPPSDPAKAGTTVSVAATTEDAYPIMYMLACVSTQSAGQLRATEGHQHD
jgi:hypothetical protein